MKKYRGLSTEDRVESKVKSFFSLSPLHPISSAQDGVFTSNLEPHGVCLLSSWFRHPIKSP
ncbi:hypothetical protein BH24DEI2_BH24DEI2_19590 [soil metagenome]